MISVADNPIGRLPSRFDKKTESLDVTYRILKLLNSSKKEFREFYDI